MLQFSLQFGEIFWATVAAHPRGSVVLAVLLVSGAVFVRRHPGATWAWLRYWTAEVRRLWVPIVAMFLIHLYRGSLDPRSDAARILYKINIVSGAVVLAHMLRSQVFPYIRLNDMLNGDHSYPPPLFLGACVLIGLFMLAVILGFTLGL